MDDVHVWMSLLQFRQRIGRYIVAVSPLGPVAPPRRRDVQFLADLPEPVVGEPVGLGQAAYRRRPDLFVERVAAEFNRRGVHQEQTSRLA